MKETRVPPPRYAPPRTLREDAPTSPTEAHVQALWFEQFYQSILITDDGRKLEVVQPGFWNHGGGPDFSRAVIRFLPNPSARAVREDASDPAGELVCGNVEVHLRAADWNGHGHHADPAYDNTILHVVWEPGGKPFFPATSSFRQVPQVTLSSQLVAPWPELEPLCGAVLQRPLPGALPGRCSPALSQLPSSQVADILRAAGAFRLRQKAQRWHWRTRLTSPAQALHEALAEALGYHANQIPMRLVAQRLPWKKLRAFSAAERAAHLFGLAGFLPGESMEKLRSEPRQWLRELWEIWWKARDGLDYALLERSDWKLAGLRPLNRPERRLAALGHLVPLMPDLIEAIRARDDDGFAQILLGIADPLWATHATLTGTPMAAPCRIIGEERVRDILINVFWPMVAMDDPNRAQQALQDFTVAPNSSARVASQRLLLAALTPRQLGEALVQQGLLQIFRDYCQTDCSQCRDCTFPELVRTWQPDGAAAG